MRASGRFLRTAFVLAIVAAPLLPGPALAVDQTITVADNSYTPSTVTVDTGDKVTWSWSGISNQHTVTFTTAGSPADCAISTPSGSCARTFNTAGTFAFHCNFHASMTGSVTVVDEPSVSIDDVSVTEGDSGSVTASFTVSISKAPDGSTASVSYATADGTASAGSDYVSKSGSLSWADGDGASKTVSVRVKGDTATEPDETFFVNLSSPSNVTIADAQGKATITNDDGTSTPPTLSIGDVTAAESSGSASFVVKLSASSESTVSVHYATADGTATAGNDYTSTSGNLSIDPGKTKATIDVPILTDSVSDPDETFTVTLSNPTNATIADGTGRGTITEGPCTISGDGDANTLEGTPGPDVICGGGGADTIDGLGGDDVIRGGGGGDTLLGRAGNDEITGGTGPDVLRGGDGNDVLRARDRVRGNDHLFGGAGTDSCRKDRRDTERGCP